MFHQTYTFQYLIIDNNFSNQLKTLYEVQNDMLKILFYIVKVNLFHPLLL